MKNLLLNRTGPLIVALALTINSNSLLAEDPEFWMWQKSDLPFLRCLGKAQLTNHKTNQPISSLELKLPGAFWNYDDSIQSELKEMSDERSTQGS